MRERLRGFTTRPSRRYVNSRYLYLYLNPLVNRDSYVRKEAIPRSRMSVHVIGTITVHNTVQLGQFR